VKLVSLSASVENVLALLDRSDKPYLTPGTVRHTGLKDAIRLDHVTFHYDSDAAKPALEDVSITIPARKTTALVGPSGAGKSTIVKLLLRFYDPTHGEVYVDERPLRELDLESWRSRISLVSQDVFVFNVPIRDNIAYGRLDASEEEIVAAARKADAHEFIMQLPDGYDTLVGDRGVRLSGGQQQRITLARAILRDPEVLILDEATNSLDSISEKLIQDAIDTMSRDRTVVVVAHRFSTIERADQIVVLEDGHVREQGDLQRLLRLNGLFSRLHQLQYRRA
jgi:ATP-binding cassette, subfamily B, bacterial MsbA